MTALISLDKVSFAYPGGPFVLEDVSVTIHEGDFAVIYGPNGAAKTTLLKIILGLLKPQKGTVYQKNPAQRMNYIPQRSNFNPGFPATVGEVVDLQVNRTLREKHQEICSVLKKVGLENKLHTLMGNLSGGQFQKVLIARCLINQPQILFLDEPTTALDPAAQLDFYSLLQKLKEDGLTIVMVTHDLPSVLPHASRFICVNQGKIREIARDILKVV